jgi:hypothetical protein
LRRDQFVIIGKAVDAAMTNHSFTNVALAEQLNCDESTVRHVRHGEKAKYDTYAKVCKQLGLRLENLLEGSHTVDGVSAAALGSYVRKAVEHYEGTYITIRPRYAAPEMMVTSPLWLPRSSSSRLMHPTFRQVLCAANWDQITRTTNSTWSNYTRPCTMGTCAWRYLSINAGQKWRENRGDTGLGLYCCTSPAHITAMINMHEYRSVDAQVKQRRAAGARQPGCSRTHHLLQPRPCIAV